MYITLCSYYKPNPFTFKGKEQMSKKGNPY